MKSGQKKILIIAYAFPPHSVVGAMRPLRIVKYLHKYTSWKPIIITVKKIFGRVDYSLLAEIPGKIITYRTRTLEPLLFIEKKLGNQIPQSKKTYQNYAQDLEINPNRLKNALKLFLKKVKLIVKDLLSTPDLQVFWNISVIIKGLQVIKKTRIDIIFVTTPPYSALLSGLILAKLTKTPWIADFRDPWTDIKRGEKTRIREKFESWLEKELVKNANGVISTSNTYTNNLKKKFPFMEEDKFFTLYNGFDEEKFINIETKISDKFTIAYLGSLYSGGNPHFFFRVLSEWITLNPEYEKNLEMIFVGELDKKTIDVIEKLHLTHVTRITGFVEHKTAISICTSADLLLLAMGTGPLTPSGCLPAKLFEYIACNKPILANAVEGEAAELIRKTKSGYVINSDDKEAIVNVLHTLYRLKREGGVGKFPWQNDVKKIEGIQQKFLIKHLQSILNRVILKADGNKE